MMVVERQGLLLHRHHRQHRAHRRGAGGDRHPGRRACARRSASSRGWPCSPSPTSAPPTIPQPEKVRRAVEMVRERRPDLIDRRRDAGRHGRGSRDPGAGVSLLRRCRAGANVLVFPDLASANIAYKLLQRLGGRRGHRADPAWGPASRSTCSSGATTWTTSSTSPAWPSWTRRSWSGPPSILRCRRWRGGRRSSAEPTGTGRGRPQRPRFRHGGGWP